MSQVITATFDGAVFRPDNPVALPDRARVRLVVDCIDRGNTESDEVMDELEKLWDEVSVDSEGVHLTRDQLHGRR
jgi:predicted DNA-binding antitoxin AbrB/MazE fold protein